MCSERSRRVYFSFMLSEKINSFFLVKLIFPSYYSYFQFLLLCETIYATCALRYSNAVIIPLMQQHTSQVTWMEYGVQNTFVHWLQLRSKTIDCRQYGQVGFGNLLEIDAGIILKFVHLFYSLIENVFPYENLKVNITITYREIHSAIQCKWNM